MKAIDTADPPYHTLEENSRSPTPDPYYFLLRLDNQISNHLRQDLRYHILPVNRISISPQYCTFTRNRNLTRSTHASTELKLDVTV